MMKKIFLCMLMLMLILTVSFTACASAKFDGSRTGNESQLIMEYKMLNTTESQELELEKGDIVKFEVVSKAGSIDISLQKGKEEPIYKSADIPTSEFQVEVKDSGTYTVLVTGKKAKGSVSVTKENNNGESKETVIEMELTENYDVSDPFVNARLFCVSDDIDVLEAAGSFQMDGESGVLEVKDNKTNEVLWKKTWDKSIDKDIFTISLEDIKKEKEYAIFFTGTKINYANIVVTFKNDLVQEREKPLK